MEDKEYGEIKTRKNFFPNDAKKLVNKPNVKILITQCEISENTKKILKDGDITVYEGVTYEEVLELREKIKEEKEREKE